MSYNLKGGTWNVCSHKAKARNHNLQLINSGLLNLTFGISFHPKYLDLIIMI